MVTLTPRVELEVTDPVTHSVYTPHAPPLHLLCASSATCSLLQRSCPLSVVLSTVPRSRHSSPNYRCHSIRVARSRLSVTRSAHELATRAPSIASAQSACKQRCHRQAQHRKQTQAVCPSDHLGIDACMSSVGVGQVKSSQVKSSQVSQVKSSQVKSSQVKSSQSA